MTSRPSDHGETQASALTFSGASSDPRSVLRIQIHPVPKTLAANEVVVQMLAAPVNPQDLLIVAGMYPIRPSHNINQEAIPGYDGVGRIINLGSNVTTLQRGDFVIPRGQGFGTWRTYAVVDASECAKVPFCSDIRFAAMLKMTILPAYFLVEDLYVLKPGDWIVQTAATSSVAQMVTQFARLKGAHTISIIREDPSLNHKDAEKVKAMLFDKGANIVCTESELEREASTILHHKKIVLALDCVWGITAEVLVSHLPADALFVNFGNLSGGGPTARASFSHSSLFGRGITLKGWKSTSSLASRDEAGFNALTAWVISLLEDGRLQMPEFESVTWAPAQVSAEDSGRLQGRLLDSIVRSPRVSIRRHKVLFEFRN